MTPAQQQIAIRFEDLSLPDEVLIGVRRARFESCTPIQAATLPHALAGRDVLGQAQTGTGKTAAFLLAAFARLLPDRAAGHRIRTLVLAPTRELALQIVEEAKLLGSGTGLNVVCLVGGIDYQRQRRDLAAGVDIVVATPGRLLDFLRQGTFSLGEVQVAVIDEADRMLDMGFIPDVKRILRELPPPGTRQTMLFSATLNTDVRHLARQWTRDPFEVAINPEQITVKEVRQLNVVVKEREKFRLLVRTLRHWKALRVLVFTNRKTTADSLSRRLLREGIVTDHLSGDVSQRQRLRSLARFRKGEAPVLVATDLASRGLHIEDVSLVVNYDIPYEPEGYVHRIGRTARRGKEGVALNLVCEAGGFYMAEVERLLGADLATVSEAELLDRLDALAPAGAPPAESLLPAPVPAPVSRPAAAAPEVEPAPRAPRPKAKVGTRRRRTARQRDARHREDAAAAAAPAAAPAPRSRGDTAPLRTEPADQLSKASPASEAPAVRRRGSRRHRSGPPPGRS